MKHCLYWSFGEPRVEDGFLVANFYYQPGKHVALRLPWPVRSFQAAGNLAIGTGFNETAGLSLSQETMQAGQRLFDYLGPEVQASIIHTFANLPDSEDERILYLQFSPPSSENREACLALESLPWEWLHDGRERLATRYAFQIIRSHVNDTGGTLSPVTCALNSWRILLTAPFVYASETACQKVGLAPLPSGRKETRTLRQLVQQTQGIVRVEPQRFGSSHEGVTTFAELEERLMNPQQPYYPLLHFLGHGVIYDGEPCLCFEDQHGGVDYVSVERFHKLFSAVQNTRGKAYLPAAIFLNACGSSTRGRYSSGFASGLHDLGIGVLGYSSEIRDDELPVTAAHAFYQSLCVQQALQNPERSPRLINAVGDARQHVRRQEDKNSHTGGNLRAYLPVDVSFAIRGRNGVERFVQALYSRWADWLNPLDYTDHLSLGFSFALIFGVLLGLQNLLLIFPEAIRTQYLTYEEIVSELARVFLVGPLSFLAAAMVTAWQTRRNYKFLRNYFKKSPSRAWLGYIVSSLPICFLAGAVFALLFAYSFSRLEILTIQTVMFAGGSQIPVPRFWYLLNGGLGLCVASALWAASIIQITRRESLHSYHTYHILILLYLGMLAANAYSFVQSFDSNQPRFVLWGSGVVIHVCAYALAVTKAVKEAGWRASQKRKEPAALSWRKLAPLLGGVALALVCYVFLEQTARFRPHIIQEAMLARKASIDAAGKDMEVVKILERALRQRAVQEIPDSVLDQAGQDWLLSVVSADYHLYRAFQENDSQELESRLERSLEYLQRAAELNPEVVFEDYYNNILAMVQMLRAGLVDDSEARKALLEAAREKAQRAVQKDELNFAYLDTLARIEARLAVLYRDRQLLQKAARHNREAQWNAFFLRSYRADEVRRTINQMADYIERQKEELAKIGSTN